MTQHIELQFLNTNQEHISRYLSNFKTMSAPAWVKIRNTSDQTILIVAVTQIMDVTDHEQKMSDCLPNVRVVMRPGQEFITPLTVNERRAVQMIEVTYQPVLDTKHSYRVKKIIEDANTQLLREKVKSAVGVASPDLPGWPTNNKPLVPTYDPGTGRTSFLPADDYILQSHTQQTEAIEGYIRPLPAVSYINITPNHSPATKLADDDSWNPTQLGLAQSIQAFIIVAK